MIVIDGRAFYSMGEFPPSDDGWRDPEPFAIRRWDREPGRKRPRSAYPDFDAPEWFDRENSADWDPRTREQYDEDVWEDPEPWVTEKGRRQNTCEVPYVLGARTYADYKPRTLQEYRSEEQGHDR